MKTLTLLILLLPFLTFPAMGQEVDFIQLKSGSVIRGSILEIQPGGQVHIQDLGGNTWSFAMSEVDKIGSEAFDNAGFSGYARFEQGFVNITSMGFLAGASNNEQPAPFSLQMTNGWRSNFGLFSGLGLGIEFLRNNYFPVFADLRYDLLGEDVVACLLLKGGFSFPLDRAYKEYDVRYAYEGGPMLAAGAGLKIRTRENFAWDVALMYRYQRIAYSESYSLNMQDYEYTDIYNRIEIRLGFYLD